MWHKEDAYRLSQMRNKRHISARKMSSDLGLSENYINKYRKRILKAFVR